MLYMRNGFPAMNRRATILRPLRGAEQRTCRPTGASLLETEIRIRKIKIPSYQQEKAGAFITATWPPAHNQDFTWEPLAGDGSDRRFQRIRSENKTVILVYGPDAAENKAYSAIGRHLWRIGEIGPRFLGEDLDLGLFLIEDLGNVSLQIQASPASEADKELLYSKVIDLLLDFQLRGLNGFDLDWPYQTVRYDKELILSRETGYFMQAFIRGYLGLAVAGGSLDLDFEALADTALAGGETFLLHRDFQSRNIMIHNDRPRLIDFQGARLGPSGYDLASLLYDPYVVLAAGLSKRLLDFYLNRRSALEPRFDHTSFTRSFQALAVCRLLQAMGAYGFLIKVKAKKDFQKYILPALINLQSLLNQELFDFLPKLRRLVGEIACRIEV
ncbi:MAG: phosphotransferase [Deltaproteobacteria bacterium]|nr:phosphotransferase [Deltaproteobacteria bacterium]